MRTISHWYKPSKIRLKSLSLFALFVICLSLQFSCHPRTVVRDGVRVPYDQAAQSDFQKAQDLFAQGKKAQAIVGYKNVAKDFPQSDWADDALSKLGDIYFSDGNYNESALYYQNLVEDYRSSNLNTRATFRLGVSYYKLDRFVDTIRVLQPITSRFSDPIERLEIYSFLTRSFENLNRLEEALPLYVSMHSIYRYHELGTDLQTPFIKIASADFIESRIIEIINQTNDPRVLRQWIGKYGNAFPAQHALLRLSRLQLNEDDDSMAEANLEELIKRFPNDFLNREARLSLKRIQSRYMVNENRIGVILPLTGPHSGYGTQTLAGIELAVSALADALPDSPIEFVIKDSQSDPEIAAKAVNQLVIEDQVIAIIGPLFSLTSIAAVKEAQMIGVPIISLSSAEGIPRVGSFVFRNSLTPQSQVEALIEYAREKLNESEPKLKDDFAILYPNHSYGTTMRDYFWDQVLREGGEIRAVESYKPGQTDFKVEVQKIAGLYYKEPRKAEWEQLKRDAQKEKDKGRRIRMRDLQLPPIVDFGALFIPDYYRTATIIADFLPYFDIENVLLLGDSNWNNPEILKRNIKNIQGATFTDSFYVKNPKANVQTFVVNYRNTFGEDPQRHAAAAYDSANILIDLLQDPLNHSRESLKSALLKMNPFDGVTGLTRFDENGEIDKKPILLQIQGEEIVDISHSLPKE